MLQWSLQELLLLHSSLNHKVQTTGLGKPSSTDGLPQKAGIFSKLEQDKIIFHFAPEHLEPNK